MRFLLYNIRYGTGTGQRFHFPVPYSGYLRPTQDNFNHIKEFMQGLQPDVIGLVEVDNGSFRADRDSQPVALAEALGHYSVYQSKYGTKSLARRLPLMRQQGNAFLTREKIREQRFHYFKNGVKRLVIELELDRVTFLLVHLSLKFRHRHYQLWELFTLVKEIQAPLILAGDFNVFRGDRELRLFLEATGLRNANADNAPTFPSRAPRRQLDYILHSPDIRVTNFQIPQVTFSDHLPLVCDFEVADQP